MPDTTEKTLANEKVLSETPDGEEPTPEEKLSLRHVAENLPISAWLVAVVELCERFTYYGMQGLFQNYINLPLDGSEGRGALGMGHQGATGLTTFFQFWCYGTSLYPSLYCRCALVLTAQLLRLRVLLSPISISGNTKPLCCSVVCT